MAVTLDSSQQLEFANNIADHCYRKYISLSKTGKPDASKEWTLLSAVVKVSGIVSADDVHYEVVALGTGSKCIGQNEMSSDGDVLNDSHAEVVARRGFLRYLYHQVDLTYRTGVSDVFQTAVDGKCVLKSDVSFHFFTSHTPCGDGSIFQKTLDSEDFGECLQSNGANTNKCCSKSESECLQTDLVGNGVKFKSSMPIGNIQQTDSFTNDENNLKKSKNGLQSDNITSDIGLKEKDNIFQNAQLYGGEGNLFDKTTSHLGVIENEQNKCSDIVRDNIVGGDEMSSLTGTKRRCETELTPLKRVALCLDEQVPTRGSHVEQLDEQVPTRGSDVEQSEEQVPTHSSDVEQSDEQVPTRGSDVEQSDEQVPTRGSHVEQSDEQVPTRGSHVEQSDEQVPTQSSDVEQSDEQVPTHSSDVEQSDEQVPTRGSHVEQSDEQVPTRGSDVEQSYQVWLDVHRTGAKCVTSGTQDRCGRGTEYHVVGVLRTKPGRGDPTLSLSCSDKLARWHAVGSQGALLSLLVAAPVYFQSLIVGGGCPFSHAALSRAVVQRSRSLARPLLIAQSSEAFVDGRTRDNGKRPCASSVAWCNVPHRPLEVAVKGRKQGVTKKMLKTSAGRLLICKKELAVRFVDVVSLSPHAARLVSGLTSGGDVADLKTKTYKSLKSLAHDYQHAWQRVRTNCFPAWPYKPEFLNNFTVNR